MSFGESNERLVVVFCGRDGAEIVVSYDVLESVLAQQGH
jgi:hypothetical protein